eukprot:7994013-Pyramimonas_sp.AAC.1
MGIARPPPQEDPRGSPQEAPRGFQDASQTCNLFPKRAPIGNNCPIPFASQHLYHMRSLGFRRSRWGTPFSRGPTARWAKTSCCFTV